MRLSVKLFPIMFLVSFVIGSVSNYRLFFFLNTHSVINIVNGSIYYYVGLFFLSVLAPSGIFYLIGKHYDLFSEFKALSLSLFLASITGFFAGLYLSALFGLYFYNSYFLEISFIKFIAFYNVFDIFSSFQFLIIFLSAFFGLVVGQTIIKQREFWGRLMTKIHELNENSPSNSIIARGNILFAVKIFALVLPVSCSIGFFSSFDLFSILLNFESYFILMFIISFLVSWVFFFLISKLGANMTQIIIILFSSLFAISVGYAVGLWVSSTWGWLLLGLQYPWVDTRSGLSGWLVMWSPTQSVCIFLVAFFALAIGFRRNLLHRSK